MGIIDQVRDAGFDTKDRYLEESRRANERRIDEASGDLADLSEKAPTLADLIRTATRMQAGLSGSATK